MIPISKMTVRRRLEVSSLIYHIAKYLSIQYMYFASETTTDRVHVDFS